MKGMKKGMKVKGNPAQRKTENSWNRLRDLAVVKRLLNSNRSESFMSTIRGEGLPTDVSEGDKERPVLQILRSSGQYFTFRQTSCAQES